jgi:RsiG-like
MSSSTDREGTPMEDIVDLVSLSDAELKALINELVAEEREISRRRRILHGKIDILRAELVLRLQRQHEEGKSIISGDDLERLSEILAGKGPYGGEPGSGEPGSEPKD